MTRSDIFSPSRKKTLFIFHENKFNLGRSDASEIQDATRNRIFVPLPRFVYIRVSAEAGMEIAQSIRSGPRSCQHALEVGSYGYAMFGDNKT